MAWALQGLLGEKPPPLQTLVVKQVKSYRDSGANPPTTDLLFSQPWPPGTSDHHPGVGSYPSCSRTWGPNSHWSVCMWGREPIGGSPNCEAHVLPAKARLRAMGGEQDHTLQTGSTDRP